MPTSSVQPGPAVEDVRPRGEGGGPDARNCGITVLYRRHRRALLQRARVLLGGPDEAEDILQAVFLALVANPELHRGEASVFTLLYQMVTHKALDQRRARSRRRDCLAFLGPPAAEAERAGHRGGIERVEAARELQRMTRSESPRALTAARLHFLDGHTQEEVAQVLGVSRKTVGRVLGGLTARERATSAPRAAATPVRVSRPAAGGGGASLESRRAGGPGPDALLHPPPLYVPFALAGRDEDGAKVGAHAARDCLHAPVPRCPLAERAA